MSDYRVHGDTGEWEVVVGLEVHAQVTSNAKLFSGASTTFGAEPNTQVSLVDAAMPGMLPVPNRECIRQAVRTGMAIAVRKLDQIDASATIEDLRVPPGNRLEKLKGDRAGQWSIRINDQWRICFRWMDGEASDVEIVDYH